MTFITCDISGSCKVFEDDGLRLDGWDIDGTTGTDAFQEHQPMWKRSGKSCTSNRAPDYPA